MYDNYPNTIQRRGVVHMIMMITKGVENVHRIMNSPLHLRFLCFKQLQSIPFSSCVKEERRKKKKNLLFDDLPESPEEARSPGQPEAGGPGSRPLTKLGSASSRCDRSSGI
jgi:hypothetical protein